MDLPDRQRLMMKYMSKYKDLPCYISEFGMGKTRYTISKKYEKIIEDKEYERKMDMEEQERIKEEKEKNKDVINCYQCGSDRIESKAIIARRRIESSKVIISDGLLTTVNLFKCADCNLIFENPEQ